jgi:DNA polymerase-1
MEAMASAGVLLPVCKAARSRIRCFDFPSGENKEVTVTMPSGKKTVERVFSYDNCGNLFRKDTTEASGFWAYIDDRSNNIIHSSFVLHATNTGRTASRNPNLQNTPKRGEMAKVFRKVFRPSIDGWKFLELDYSQIELRIAAWEAGEKNMIQIYKTGGDIHAFTAAGVIGVPYEKFAKGRKDETPLIEVANAWPASGQVLRALSLGERQRFTVKDFCELKRYQAKAINFGYIYGMWWKGFKVYAKTTYQVDYTDAEAEQTRVKFFKSYPGLERWHSDKRRAVRRDAEYRGLHGAIRRLPNVDSFDESVVAGSERQGINASVQRFASDLGLIAVNRVMRDASRDIVRPVMFIHDSMVPIVHPDYVEEVASAIKYYMENPPLEAWFGIKPPFPLVADVKAGDDFGEMEDLDVEAVKPSWFRSGEACPAEARAAQEGWAVKKRRGIVLEDV